MAKEPIQNNKEIPDLSRKVLEHRLTQADQHAKTQEELKLMEIKQRNDHHGEAQPAREAQIELQNKANEKLSEISDKLEKPEVQKVSIEGKKSDVATAFFEMLKGDKGDDGKTPKKGEDYFTAEEIKNFKDEITPVKGKDYNDGKDGKNADEEKIIKEIFDKIPKPKNGRDGYTPIKGVDYNDGNDGKDGKNGSDGSPDTGDQIVDKLTLLKGDKRLSYKSLKDAPTIFKDAKGGGAMKGTGYLGEITDVVISNPANSDGLVYNSTTKKWENSPSVNTGEKVKASATDATPGYLDGKVTKSIVVASDKLQLSGDASTPGNSKYYGTDGSGAKGFFTMPNPDLSAYATLKKTVVDETDTYDVVVGDTGNVLTMSHASTKTFNLPVIAAGDVGTQITFVKKGAGKVVIQANTGQFIDDSTSAGTIYDDQVAELTSTVTLLAISTTQWVIVSANGIWITT